MAISLVPDVSISAVDAIFRDDVSLVFCHSLCLAQNLEKCPRLDIVARNNVSNTDGRENVNYLMVLSSDCSVHYVVNSVSSNVPLEKSNNEWYKSDAVDWMRSWAASIASCTIPYGCHSRRLVVVFYTLRQSNSCFVSCVGLVREVGLFYLCCSPAKPNH